MGSDRIYLLSGIFHKNYLCFRTSGSMEGEIKHFEDGRIFGEVLDKERDWKKERALLGVVYPNGVIEYLKIDNDLVFWSIKQHPRTNSLDGRYLGRYVFPMRTFGKELSVLIERYFSDETLQTASFLKENVFTDRLRELFGEEKRGNWRLYGSLFLKQRPVLFSQEEIHE